MEKRWNSNDKLKKWNLGGAGLSVLRGHKSCDGEKKDGGGDGRGGLRSYYIFQI